MCDIVGCDEKSVYEDYMQINYCESCYEQALTEGKEPDEFEPVFQEKKHEDS